MQKNKLIYDLWYAFEETIKPLRRSTVRHTRRHSSQTEKIAEQQVGHRTATGMAACPYLAHFIEYCQHND